MARRMKRPSKMPWKLLICGWKLRDKMEDRYHHHKNTLPENHGILFHKLYAPEHLRDKGYYVCRLLN